MLSKEYLESLYQKARDELSEKNSFLKGLIERDPYCLSVESFVNSYIKKFLNLPSFEEWVKNNYKIESPFQSFSDWFNTQITSDKDQTKKEIPKKRRTPTTIKPLTILDNPL